MSSREEKIDYFLRFMLAAAERRLAAEAREKEAGQRTEASQQSIRK